MMNTMEKSYEYLKMENVAYTLQAIDEAVQLYNISINHNPEKYFSFQPYDNNTWMLNTYGDAENLYFRRRENDPNYFIRIPESEL